MKTNKSKNNDLKQFFYGTDREKQIDKFRFFLIKIRDIRNIRPIRPIHDKLLIVWGAACPFERGD